MDPLRNKMAEFIKKQARQAILKLDPKSVPGKALQKVDVEAILTNDIERICQEASFFEISRALALGSKLALTKNPDKKEAVTRELKKIAQAAASRVEGKSGKLLIPDCCRELLLEL